MLGDVTHSRCGCDCSMCNACLYGDSGLYWSTIDVNPHACEAAEAVECDACRDLWGRICTWQSLDDVMEWFNEQDDGWRWEKSKRCGRHVVKHVATAKNNPRSRSITVVNSLNAARKDIATLFDLKRQPKLQETVDPDGVKRSHRVIAMTANNGWQIVPGLVQNIISLTNPESKVRLHNWLNFEGFAIGAKHEARGVIDVGMNIHVCALRKFLKVITIASDSIKAEFLNHADIAYRLPFIGDEEPDEGDVVYLSSSEGGLQCSLRRPEDPLGASVVTGLMHRPHTIGNPYSNGSIPVVYFGHAGVRFRESDRSQIKPGVPLYAVNDGSGLASIKQRDGNDPVVGIAIQAPRQNDDFVEVMISSVVNNKTNQTELGYLEKLIELQKEQLELQKKQSESKPSIMNTTTMQNVTVGAQITGGTHHNSTFNISAPASFEPANKRNKK